MSIARTIVVAFFAINALFWGLFDHGSHCRVAAMIGAKDCPPHSFHIILGLACFVIAVAIAQWGYLFAAHKKSH